METLESMMLLDTQEVTDSSSVRPTIKINNLQASQLTAYAALQATRKSRLIESVVYTSGRERTSENFRPKDRLAPTEAARYSAPPITAAQIRRPRRESGGPRLLKIGGAFAVPPRAAMFPVSPDALNRSRLFPLAPPKLAPDFQTSGAPIEEVVLEVRQADSASHRRLPSPLKVSQ